MAYTLNGNIPCGTDACTGTTHSPISACKSVYDIILEAIKDVKGDVKDIESLAKEETLLNKVAELKSALSTIDFTTIEQAIKDVKAVAAKEDTLIKGVGDIIKALESVQVDVDLTPVATETTLNSAKEEILTAVENIELPEIDTTELAKQGENPDATLTAIYKLLIGSNEPSPDIPEGVAERLALILEFFGMKPIEAYEFMTPEEVCSELGEIMTSMDLDFTPEQAKEITNNTLNKEY